MIESDLYDSDRDVSSLPDGLASEVHSLIEPEEATSSSSNGNESNSEETEITRTASQAAKAIEAAEEQQSSNEEQIGTVGPSLNENPLSIRRSAWPEDVVVVDAGPAPPDYFAATAWRRTSAATTTGTSWRDSTTHEGQQNSEQHGVSRQNGEYEFQPPQVLSDVESGNLDRQTGNEGQSNDQFIPDESAPLLPRLRGGVKSSRRRLSGRLCCWCLIIGLIALAAVGISINLLTLLEDDSPSEVRGHAVTHGDPWLDHLNTTDCNFDSFSEYVDIPVLDPAHFYLLEMIDFSGSEDFELEYTIASGSVEVVYVPKNSTIVQHAPIVIRAHMATTMPWKVDIRENETFYRHKHAIHFQEPPLRRLSSSEPPIARPCLDTLILVYVRQDTVIERWDTRLFSLDFVDHEAASGYSKRRPPGKEAEATKPHISNHTEIFTEQGNIDLSSWSSNVTSVFTPGGSIAGTYDFQTLMSLMSTDGDIDVTINAIAVEGAAPEHLWGSAKFARMLQTSTFRGDTSVDVQSWPPPPEASSPQGSPVIENILTSHLSTYGDITLQYPSDWSGSIVGRTGDGRMSIVGKGVEIMPGSNPQTSRQIEARKGYGNGHLDFESWRGKSILRIGYS